MVEYQEIVTRSASVAPLLLMPAKGRRKWARDVVRRDGAAILVVPGRPGSQWWAIAMTGDALMCQIEGRVRFPGQRGGAPFPTVLVYRGPSPRVFFDAFSPLGDIFRRVTAPRTIFSAPRG